mmetsp:Transcript_8306/g.14006  ORF Transcript_8306/g.14006 Transcript_8306/m.14006 type:complete len:338 (+) Transcript_8306:3-1016(+)
MWEGAGMPWEDRNSGFIYDYGDSDDEDTQRNNYLMTKDIEYGRGDGCTEMKCLYDLRADHFERQPRDLSTIAHSKSKPRDFSTGPSDGSGKLYCGGLSFSTTDASLRAYFSRFGPIASAKVVMDPEDTSKSRGFGFVNFIDPADANHASLELNGQILEGRAIKVDGSSSNGRGVPPGPKTKKGVLETDIKPRNFTTGPSDGSGELYCSGLSWSTTDASLYACFSRFGPIVSAKVLVDREDPSKNRGCGFVNFTNPADADHASLELNGQNLDGRAIKVDGKSRESRLMGVSGGKSGGKGKGKGSGKGKGPGKGKGSKGGWLTWWPAPYTNRKWSSSDV